jgi:hypothetical protein
LPHGLRLGFTRPTTGNAEEDYLFERSYVPGLISLFVVGCSGETEPAPTFESPSHDDDGQENLPDEPYDGPEAVEPSRTALRVMDDVEDYEDWGTFVENPELRRSTGHAPGGKRAFVITFRNDVVAAAEVEATLPLPDGSMIVKENYASEADEAPTLLTVMTKQQGDWFWMQMTRAGQVSVDARGEPLEGHDVDFCLGCHADVEDNDFVYLHDFRVPISEVRDAGSD